MTLLVPIESFPNVIPHELLVSERGFIQTKQQTTRRTRLRGYRQPLERISTINNCGKRSYLTLKKSIIIPVPKISRPQLPQDIKSDLRPIALTGYQRRLLEQNINCAIDPRQYVRTRHSTQAPIYLLHAIHVAVDTGNCCARIFFADVSKGLDRIGPHSRNTFLECRLDRISGAVRAFLTNRTQVVRVGSSQCPWRAHPWWCPIGN